MNNAAQFIQHSRSHAKPARQSDAATKLKIDLSLTFLNRRGRDTKPQSEGSIFKPRSGRKVTTSGDLVINSQAVDLKSGTVFC